MSEWGAGRRDNAGRDEYLADIREVTLHAGKPRALPVRLHRSIPTPNWPRVSHTMPIPTMQQEYYHGREVYRVRDSNKFRTDSSDDTAGRIKLQGAA